MSALILAEDIDASAEAVLHALSKRGVVVHRVNTAWFPAHLSISAELKDGRWVGAMRTPGRRIELEAITAVWFRAPKAYQFPTEMSATERSHANLEAKYGLGGVLSALPALWVNHPARLADAAYKPVQLVTAAGCGLAVPHTLITNQLEPVRAFAVQEKTITKVLGANFHHRGGVRKITFTRLLEGADLADLRGVEQTTHLFQHWVPKAYDARVVVIGKHMTTAAIRASRPATSIGARTTTTWPMS